MVGFTDPEGVEGGVTVSDGVDPAARALAHLQSSGPDGAGRWPSSGSRAAFGLFGRVTTSTRAAGDVLRDRPGLVAAMGAGVVAIALVAAALIVRTSVDTPTSGPVVTIAAATTSTTRPGLVVQAAGAVRSPGVHRMSTGSRVVDLLERAGGPTLDLDLDRVNLAAALVDGQRVWFPRVGEPTPSAGGPSGSVGAAEPTVVDINQATVDQLDTLPGIGPVLSAAIVAERERHGRFADVDALSRVKGLSRTRIDAIRDLVTAG